METINEYVPQIPPNHVTPFCATHPGVFLKEELKERGIKQKDFSAVIGMQPSHLNDIIKGRRNMSNDVARKVSKALGTSFEFWVNAQYLYDYDSMKIMERQSEEKKDSFILEGYNKIFDVKSVFDALGFYMTNSKNALCFIKETLKLPNPEDMSIANEGLFKRSDKVGVDKRKLYSWVIIAKHIAKSERARGIYDKDKNDELIEKLRMTFHKNENTLNLVKETLSDYGIAFSVVGKIDGASVDGYSFVDDGIPHMIVTCRYNYVDMVAFAVMHELHHIINGDYGNLNIGDNKDSVETDANKHAADMLIPRKVWSKLPQTKLNVRSIQNTCISWANKNNLNEWIVIGRMSHELGIYNIKSTKNRTLN